MKTSVEQPSDVPVCPALGHYVVGLAFAIPKFVAGFFGRQHDATTGRLPVFGVNYFFVKTTNTRFYAGRLRSWAPNGPS